MLTLVTSVLILTTLVVTELPLYATTILTVPVMSTVPELAPAQRIGVCNACLMPTAVVAPLLVLLADKLVSNVLLMPTVLLTAGVTPTKFVRKSPNLTPLIF